MPGEINAVEKIIKEFAAAWNEHDIEAFSRLFSENAQFVNVVGIWWHGRSEIQDAHEQTHKTIFRKSTLFIDETSTRLPVRNLAIARSRWTLSGHVSPDGKPLPKRQGILVCTLLNGGNKWQIIDAQNTDIVVNEITVPQ